MSGWVTGSSGLTNICETQNTRKERFLATAFEAEVELRCNWVDRFKVIWDIYNNNVSYPDVENCLCSTFAIEPAPGKPIGVNSDGVIQYGEALIKVSYSTAEVDAQKLYIESLEPTVQGMVMNPDNFSWDSAGSDTGAVQAREAPSRHIHQWIYTVRWVQQEEIPQDFFDLPGSVNNAAYTIAKWGRVCPSETMLFTPGPSGRSVFLKLSDPSAKPQPGWDYTAKFLINNFGWNKFYHASFVPTVEGADEERWRPLYLKKSGGAEPFKPYPLKSLVPKLLPG